MSNGKEDKKTKSEEGPRSESAHEEGEDRASIQGKGYSTRSRRSSAKAHQPEMTKDSPEIVRLDFAVGRSLRYHAKRRQFLDSMHRLCMLTATIGGSGAFAASLTNAGVSGIVLSVFAALATLATATDRAFGLSEAARRHDALYRRFSDLALKLASEEPTAALVKKWSVERIRIEKDETSVLAVLNIECRNEELISRGYPPSELQPLKWWQMLFMNVCSLPPRVWSARPRGGERGRSGSPATGTSGAPGDNIGVDASTAPEAAGKENSSDLAQSG